jgi:hypothetical protein
MATTLFQITITTSYGITFFYLPMKFIASSYATNVAPLAGPARNMQARNPLYSPNYKYISYLWNPAERLSV